MDLFSAPRAADPNVTALRAYLPRLPERDRDFARSLLSSADRGSLSAKQSEWVVKLAAKAKAPAPTVTGGLGKLVDILDNAARSLKFPVLRFEANGVRYRLGRAGAQSRQPGSISVTTDEKGFDARTYFGRIDLGGTFEPSGAAGETATAIGLALRAFAADPVQQARIYGQRYGNCCFCARELTNGTSLRLGFGPICAERFGLDHS